MRRRAFIKLLGGAAAAWPLAARAQQAAKPVVGVLYLGWPAALTHLIVAFRAGLNETGFVEGQNVTIEYRFAEGQYDRLPKLAADFVRRNVAVIVTGAVTASALAAKAATSTILIVFGVADDPVKLGLVASLPHPGGNATGVNFFVAEMGAKTLGLLRELVPAAHRVGLLINPLGSISETMTNTVRAAASTLGLQIDVVHARDSREIEFAFAGLVRNKADAVLVAADALFFSRRVQLVTLAARHALPAMYVQREYADAGGLMSYGTSLTEVYRQMGIYTSRILKGARPEDLPVVQSTKFELVLNLPTARALGIGVPPTLLTIADEVIE
jgi:putative ABC transport system substrate-binding protein